MPTARSPLIFAIWPTTEPTAPVAAATTSVSPVFGWPMSSVPTYAVSPGMPSTPSAYEGRGMRGSSLKRPEPFDTWYSCQPLNDDTRSPSLNFGLRVPITRETVPPIMTSPRPVDAAYDGPSLMRPRMYGSSERNTVCIRISPSLSAGIGTSSRRKSVGAGSPCGRLASTMRRFLVGEALAVCPASSVAPTASEPAAMKSLRLCMASPKARLWDGLYLHRRPTTIQGDALSRDVARRCAQQKRDRAAQLVHADELPLRHRLEHDLLDHLLSRQAVADRERVDLRIDQRRLHVARTNSVDRDVGITGFQRDALAETDE